MSDDDWNALDVEITEAFTPGAPIKERDLFAGRQPQIALLTDAVRRAGHHAVIYGEPGVGKSSLANTFALGMHSPTRHLIYQKVKAEPNDSFTSLWKKVFKRLSYQTEVDGITVTRRVSEDYSGELDADDVQIELSNFSLNSTPVVVIDEFNLMEDPSVSL
ncbi:MAG TPA: ATP-binding protein, partial [Hyphomicrobiaceae bacterium]|nr:ATP-binding protein [Hyphomicrobiaceae bacterium]